LEINEKGCFFLEVLKEKYFLFLIYKTNIFIKLLKLMIVIFKGIFIFYIYIIGIISFVSRRKHLLSTLLRLEFIVLCLFFILIYFLNIIIFEVYFSIIFLTFRVCEGALGVSILVSIIRTHGNDYFNSFSILQC
jgi:NADH-ubiquinone oxidoreductase chain 4L